MANAGVRNAQVSALAIFSGRAMAVAALTAAIGLTANAEAFDPVAYVKAEIAKGAKTVVVPKGTYRIRPAAGEKSYFAFKGVKDLTVDFSGSRLNGEIRTRFVSCEGCTNVTVRNLTLDYPYELPFSQLEIVGVDTNRNWDLKLIDGYPDPACENGYSDHIHWPIQAYDRTTLERTNPMRFQKQIDIRRTGEGTYRLTGGGDRRGKVGDICVVSVRDTKNPVQNNAFHCSQCVSNRFENVTVYATPHGVFFNEYFCEATTYLNCRGIRCPPEDDPVRRGFRRVRSGNHDAFMSRGAVIGPKLIDCVAEYHCDDCVNIGGKYAFVTRAEGDTLRVVADGLGAALYPGYPAQAMSFEGACHDVKVLAVEKDEPPTAEERKFMGTLGFWPSIAECCNKGLKVKLDRAVDLPRGSVIISSRQTGNGFEIRNCRFGHNRGQGLRIQASDGVIADTVIDGAEYDGMFIIMGYIWLEGSCSRNLVVTGNTVKNTPHGITVGGSSGAKKPLPATAHRDLFFKDNSFVNLPNGAMTVSGCTGVSVFGNRYENIGNGQTLSFRNCEDVCTNAPAAFPDWNNATLEGRADRDRAIYAPGEEMVFTIRPAGRPGPVPEGKFFIDWKRTGDDGEVASGRAPYRYFEPLVIRTSMRKPGFVRIVANVVDADGKKVAKTNQRWEKRVFFEGGACVEPEKLRSLPAPADLDAYWEKVRAEIAAVPVKELERVEMPSRDPKVKVYAVKVASAGPRPVTGYLTVPAGAANGGKYPASLCFPGATHDPQTAPTGGSHDHIVFTPNSHGYELGRDKAYYRDFFKSIEPRGEHYGMDSEQNKSRDTSYLKQMAMRGIRAAQYLMSLDCWDGRTLSVGGGSMGSYQGLLVAANVPEVKSADANGCWGLDWGGRTQGRIPSGFGPASYQPETAYFDPCVLAPKIRCRVSIWSGLGDYVSPPSGLTVLYNQLGGPRTIKYVQGCTHGYRPKGQPSFTMSASGSAQDEIAKWDPAMAQKSAVVTNGVKWIDGKLLPLEGRAFDDTEHFYDRLPKNVTTNVNGGVRSMKHHTSGMLFRFRTDSKTLAFKWTPYSLGLSMDHMAATGVSGIDVYRFDERAGAWRYVKTGRICDAKKGGSLSIGWTPGDACLVNLPLYNGVRSFELGVDPKAKVEALAPRKSGVDKPVVFYGTSITHGGCCTRPGLSFVNWLGRDLDVPVVNLGFSGSGLMEIEMSEHLARIDASCYVLDCLWNMRSVASGDERRNSVEENYEPFIRNLRAKRPGVPIVMAESSDVYFGACPRSKHHQAKDRVAKALFEKLTAEGWKDLHWLPKDKMYSGDYEGTVDGNHPNDLGMQTLKNAFGTAVRKALKLR